jgi:AraC-like DNA-binding protein
VTHKKPAGLSGIAEFGYDVFRKTSALGPPRHKGHELVLIVAGHVTWRVEKETYDVRGGQLWKAAPGEKHRGLGKVVHPCEVFWIVVEPTAAGLKMTKAEVTALEKNLTSAPHVVRAPRDAELSMRNAMRELAAGETAAARGLLIYAINLMARSFAPEKGASKRKMPPGIRKALALIDESLSDPPSVQRLAKQVGLSASSLGELFRDHVGMTPADYATSRRIDVACGKLTETEASIGDIAKELGFGSAKRFSDAFEGRMGVTPGAHRASKPKPKLRKIRSGPTIDEQLEA